MPFRLRKDARKWFGDIRPKFKIEFDTYYFCLMAGLATGRKETISTGETAELVDNFPDLYRSRKDVIIALFLSKELEIMGVSMSEKRQVHDQIARLVNPQDPSGLSTTGMQEINYYSYGGYDVLANEWFDDRPRTIEVFLPMYKMKLDQAIGNHPYSPVLNWKIK